MNVFFCHLCQLAFNTEYNLGCHMQNEHTNVGHEMLIDQLDGNTSHCDGRLGLDQLDAYNGRHYSCPMCNKYFEMFYDLNIHLSTAHESDHLFTCEDCEQIFPSFLYLEHHMTVHGSTSSSSEILDQHCDSVYEAVICSPPGKPWDDPPSRWPWKWPGWLWFHQPPH